MTEENVVGQDVPSIDLLGEEEGDQCEVCGRFTDCIMQSKRGYVCECCYEEDDGDSQYDY